MLTRSLNPWHRVSKSESNDANEEDKESLEIHDDIGVVAPLETTMRLWLHLSNLNGFFFQPASLLRNYIKHCRIVLTAQAQYCCDHSLKMLFSHKLKI